MHERRIIVESIRLWANAGCIETHPLITILPLTTKSLLRSVRLGDDFPRDTATKSSSQPPGNSLTLSQRRRTHPQMGACESGLAARSIMSFHYTKGRRQTMYPLKKARPTSRANARFRRNFEEEHGRKGLYGKSAHLITRIKPTVGSLRR